MKGSGSRGYAQRAAKRVRSLKRESSETCDGAWAEFKKQQAEGFGP